MAGQTDKLRPTIVLLGDSITQWGFRPNGWGNLLAHHYMRKADVINRGFSGYNSAWVLQAVGKLLVPNALLVTIFLGANDAVLPDGTSSRQYVPLDDYRRNIQALVAAARNVSAANIVIIAPPPVDEAARVAYNKDMHGENAKDTAERSNANTGLYAAACVEVGQAEGVAVVDLWTRLQEQPQWQALLSDGLHLSAAGNAAVFEQLRQCIDSTLPHAAPDVLPLDMPLHGDLTAGSYKEVLQAYLP
eukprot:jgi/Ulvmu1/196/UM001_0200.1